MYIIPSVQTSMYVCVCALTSQREISTVNQILKFYLKVVQNINYWLHRLRGILLWSPYVNLYILPFLFKREKKKKKKKHNESKKQNPALSSIFKTMASTRRRKTQPTSASISACLFSKSFATAMALCLPDRLQLTAHSHSSVTTASSLGAA